MTANSARQSSWTAQSTRARARRGNSITKNSTDTCRPRMSVMAAAKEMAISCASAIMSSEPGTGRRMVLVPTTSTTVSATMKTTAPKPIDSAQRLVVSLKRSNLSSIGEKIPARAPRPAGGVGGGNLLLAQPFGPQLRGTGRRGNLGLDLLGGPALDALAHEGDPALDLGLLEALTGHGLGPVADHRLDGLLP